MSNTKGDLKDSTSKTNKNLPQSNRLIKNPGEVVEQDFLESKSSSKDTMVSHTSSSSQSTSGDEIDERAKNGESSASKECTFLSSLSSAIFNSENKDVLAWKKPMRSAAIFSFLLVFTITKFSQPILPAVMNGMLIMIIFSGAAKIASLKYPIANEYLDFFVEMDDAKLSKMYDIAVKYEKAFSVQCCELLTMKKPLKTAIVAGILYVMIQLLAQKVLVTVSTIILILAFFTLPVSKKVGVDVEPLLIQGKNIVCSTVSSIAKSAGIKSD